MRSKATCTLAALFLVTCAPSRGAARCADPTLQLLASDGAAEDYLGGAVSMDGDRVLAGAAYLFDAVTGADTLETDAGSAYRFDLGAQGASHCQATASSTGLPATLSACCSTRLASNDRSLTAQPVPDPFHLFFHGSAPQHVPFGVGSLCASAPLIRMNPPAPASGHAAVRALDFPSDGIPVPGTYYFQCWYRDPAAGGAGFNLSEGLELAIVP